MEQTETVKRKSLTEKKQEGFKKNLKKDTETTSQSPIKSSDSNENSSEKSNSPVYDLKNNLDPQRFNKFSNDGSFLSLVLSKSEVKPQKTCSKPVVNSSQAKRAPNATHKQHCLKKQKQQVFSPRELNTEETPVGYEDEIDVQAREEFLRTMKIMEEAGLVTEKGIGAGMVK